VHRHAWLVITVVACGPAPQHPVATAPQVPPADPPAQPTTPVNPGVAVDLVPPAPAFVTAPQTRAPIMSPHGGVIDQIAVAPDGNAALSIDIMHGVRLWPALDGSQEPYVVSMPAARQLALGRRAAGFTAVALDDVGGLIINNLDAQGRLQTHATLAADPAYTEIAMSDAGLVALRSDQVLLLIGDDGKTRSMLPADPGQRIVDIIVRGGAAIALIETAEGAKRERRGREVALAPKLAWGKFLGAASTEPDVVLAVSPSGNRIAWLGGGADGAAPKLTVIDLAHQGAELASLDTGEAVAVDFLDDTHVVFATMTAIAIADITTKVPTNQMVPTGNNGGRATFGVAGGKVIAGFDGELVIASPKSTAYLGYGVQAPTLAAAGPKGRLVVGLPLTGALLELDDSLSAVNTPRVAVAEGQAISEIAWLGDTHWAVEMSDPSNATVALQLVDAAAGTTKAIRSGMKVSSVLAYEPSTNLLTLSFGDSAEVYHYDASHALVRVAGLPAAKKVYEQTSLVPVAPKLAGGVQLIRLAHGDQLGIQWLKDPRALDKPAVTATADSFAAADAAGRVYAWRAVPGENLQLVVLDQGKQLATLPADGPVNLWPDPTGSLVLEIGQRTVALYTVKGKLVWTQQLVGSHEAYWLGDGSIALISAAGVARLDAKNGEVKSARCGWSFGLSSKPHPTGPMIEPVCAQLDR
jgi:hypothetical protein